MIPADDKYICLLTGTLSTIVTVGQLAFHGLVKLATLGWVRTMKTQMLHAKGSSPHEPTVLVSASKLRSA